MKFINQTQQMVRGLRPLLFGMTAALLLGGCAVGYSSSGGASGGGDWTGRAAGPVWLEA